MHSSWSGYVSIVPFPPPNVLGVPVCAAQLSSPSPAHKNRRTLKDFCHHHNPKLKKDLTQSKNRKFSVSFMLIFHFMYVAIMRQLFWLSTYVNWAYWTRLENLNNYNIQLGLGSHYIDVTIVRSLQVLNYTIKATHKVVPFYTYKVWTNTNYIQCSSIVYLNWKL